MANRALNSHKLIKDMAYAAILLALGVVLTLFGSFYVPGATWLRIGLGSIPIVASSLLLGPFWGLLVGAGTDVIQHFLLPAGDYFFGYTIDAALEGVLPYLTMLLFKGRTKSRISLALILFSLLTIVGIVFVSLFDTFKKNPLPMWLRILIPFLFLLYFSAVFTSFYFLDKTKTFAPALREERRFSLSDMYLVNLVNASFITIPLYALWTNIFFEVNYWVLAFSQILVFAVNGIIRAFIMFFIMNALLKADSSLLPDLQKASAQNEHTDNIESQVDSKKDK